MSPTHTLPHFVSFPADSCAKCLNDFLCPNRALSRSWDHGNPRAYSTFIDEGLNRLVRMAAAGVHRASVDKSVFQCFVILAAYGRAIHLYAPRV